MLIGPVLEAAGVLSFAFCVSRASPSVEPNREPGGKGGCSQSPCPRPCITEWGGEGGRGQGPAQLPWLEQILSREAMCLFPGHF